MTDSGETLAAAANSSAEAVIERVGFDVAHDSDGLLVVTLRYPNGANADLQLEGPAIGRIVARLGLSDVRELVGQPFSALAPALPANERAV